MFGGMTPAAWPVDGLQLIPICLLSSKSAACYERRSCCICLNDCFGSSAHSALPVHAGVRSLVVEGPRGADAALLALVPTLLRDGQGGAAALAGGHAGAVLHGGRTGDGCRDKTVWNEESKISDYDKKLQR